MDVTLTSRPVVVAEVVVAPWFGNGQEKLFSSVTLSVEDVRSTTPLADKVEEAFSVPDTFRLLAKVDEAEDINPPLMVDNPLTISVEDADNGP